MFKTLLALILSVATAICLCACGTGSNGRPASTTSDAGLTTNQSPSSLSGSVVEVDFWHCFDNEREASQIEAIVEEYNKNQDIIHITATYMSRDELRKQYTAGTLSGELPDIGMIDSPEMASYVEIGTFQSISQYITKKDTEDFYPVLLSTCMDSGGTLYGLPQNATCLALCVNLDILNENGFTEAPKSILEFQDMVSACTDSEAGVYGFAMSAKANEEGTFQILPWLRGVHEGKSANIDNLDAKSGVKGLSVLTDFVEEGYMNRECVNWGQEDALREFINGNAAMVEIETWQLNDFYENNNEPDFNYQIAFLPTGDEDSTTSVVGGQNLALCTGAEDAAACVDFLKFACSSAIQKQYAETTGKIPVRKYVTPAYPYEKAGFRTFKEEMSKAFARGPHAEWPSISEAIYLALQSAFLGETSPEEALLKAMETIDPICEKQPLFVLEDLE